MAGPTYTFTPTTPQSPNPMNGTQPVILENFQAINEFVNVNHVGFNISNTGKHNFISMPNRTAPGTTSTEIAMFTQVTGSPNPCEIFIQYPLGSQSSEISIQISQPAPTPATGSSGGNATEGWCSFPSGIIFRWGTFTCASTSNPQVFIIWYNEGPQYKTFQTPAAVAPISSGCKVPTGVYVYQGIGIQSGSTITYGTTPVALYASVSSSTPVTFNFLLMGM
jgi:hypothetical protein